MNLQTFKAPTMALCLQQVKSTMGPDAVILHTRTYRLRGWIPLLPGPEVVEVTVAKSLAKRRPPPAADEPAPALPRTPKLPGGTLYGEPLTPQPPRPAPARPPAALPPPPVTDLVANGKAIGETPAGVGIMVRNLNDEMAALRALVGEVVKQTQMNAVPAVPDGLFDHYQNLIANRVAQELAVQIVKSLPKELRPDQLARPDCVREKLAEHIERLVPSCGPVVRRPGPGPHVLALIGPTGVGKTTTLAKLAANLKLKEGHRVGLITLDTYRIAAVDQLRRYADIIGSPLRVVSNVEELRSAVAGLSDMDFVLIDTAGRSPNDVMKLNELRELLGSINPDDVHLVLSSTCCQDDVELAFQRFSDVRVDKIIFTKLDEASHVGMVLNVCNKVNKALSYVTTGQEVPNDIEVGRGRVLARMILQQPKQLLGTVKPQ